MACNRDSFTFNSMNIASVRTTEVVVTLASLKSFDVVCADTYKYLMDVFLNKLENSNMKALRTTLML
jgi:hypothetical protein